MLRVLYNWWISEYSKNACLSLGSKSELLEMISLRYLNFDRWCSVCRTIRISKWYYPRIDGWLLHFCNCMECFIVINCVTLCNVLRMHCVLLAILSQLSGFTLPQVAYIDLSCVDVPLNTKLTIRLRICVSNASTSSYTHVHASINLRMHYLILFLLFLCASWWDTQYEKSYILKSWCLKWVAFILNFDTASSLILTMSIQ